LGLDALPLSDRVEGRDNDDWKGSNPMEALRLVFRSWLDRAPQEIVDLRGDLAAFDPHVVVVDVNAWGAMTAAEGAGRPWVAFCPYFLEADLPGRPPFGLGLRPWAGWPGRWRDRIGRWLLRRAVRPGLRGLNQLRQGERLEPLTDLAQLPLRADHLVYLTAPPFEYDHGGWSSRVHLVGPGTWEPPELLQGVPHDRPLVLVTCSTEYQRDERLIEVALLALADEDVHVVVTAGAVDPARFVAPPNATVARFLPHGPILRRAVAVVCHGGMGITQKALSYGVPVCVVPFGRDQNDVAAHVVQSKAGTRLLPSRLTPSRLREAVRQARSCTDGARAIARAFAKLDPAKLGADVVEQAAPPERAGERRSTLLAAGGRPA
jgi:MGT family glycosyltransferase